MSGDTTTPSNQWTGVRRRLQAVLRIRPKGSCFMDHLEGDVSDVEIRFEDGDCQSEVVLCERGDDGRCIDIHHHAGPICTNCPGVVFKSYGLMPRFLERTDDEFVVRTYLPLEHQLSDLVGDLREVSHEVQVCRIVDSLAEDADGLTSEIDLSRLTDTQRETLKYAIEAGYYESPQQVSLEELARDFDRSKSALHQRLARAERAVMNQVFDA